jgi:hypothetical protein
MRKIKGLKVAGLQREEFFLKKKFCEFLLAIFITPFHLHFKDDF